MVGAPITAYNGSLEHFIGAYRTYSNPIAVESGHCDNELNYNSNSCGALQTELTLQPGESKELIFVLGRKTVQKQTKSCTPMKLLEKWMQKLQLSSSSGMKS